MNEPQSEEKAAISAELKRMLEDSRKLDEEAIAYLRSKGIEPPARFLTVRNYATQFGVPVETVNEWIDTGVIPVEDVQVFPEFKNARLVKAIPYGHLANPSTDTDQ